MLTNFNKDIKDNLYYDYKEYKFNDINIRRSIIKSNTEDRLKYFDEYVSKMDDNNINLIIWCDYNDGNTYLNYNGKYINHPYFTTSTNLILRYLDSIGIFNL